MRDGRSQVAHLGLVGAALFLALTGVSAVGCQHSPEVKALADEAALNMGPGGAGPGVATPKYYTEGLDPTEALKVTEAPVATPPPAAPVVEEGARVACEDKPVRDLYIPSEAIQAEAKQILSQMTLAQKVVQITGVEPNYQDNNRWEDIQRSRDEAALNLRGYQWRDGPHGLNLEAGLGRDPLENYSTSFPVSVSQGATFDMDLVRRVGEAMAAETVAAGNGVLLAPCMNLLRHPRWGRAQETFGEDTYHLGRIATGVTLGLQEHITGCAKHYLGNNVDTKRMLVNAQMDAQTMREVYGRHFEMVVRDGGVGCMMAAYNKVNGIKSTQNKEILTDMLRYDMGFRGFVLTDWWAMPAGINGQGPADPPVDLFTAREALEAGLDVEVPWTVHFDAIPALVTGNTIDISLVDRAVLRVLEQKLRFKSAYLDQPVGLKVPSVGYDAAKGSITGAEAHADLARENAEKGMVLLKNAALASGLPALPITGAATVAVIGATVDYSVNSDRPKAKKFNFVTDVALGDRGSSRVRPNPALAIGPLAGIQAAAAAKGVNVISGATAADAANADFVVVIVGLTAGDEGEEYTGASDRETLSLGDIHNNLVQQVAALGKPTAVIVQSGGIVDMPWLNSVNAAIMAWYPGQRGGQAMGRLLFGEGNFSGRLPVTWPQNEAQFPNFNDGDTTVMDYYAGYRLFDKQGIKPLFAFGHGLSYSTFNYERLHIPCGEVTDNGLISIDVDVRNAAGPAGDEVVMVFASYPQTTARRSVKELKGFARVSLATGEAKRVSIPLRIQDLKYWDTTSSRWVVEKGPVRLQVGPSSDRLLLEQTITVK